MNARRDPSWLDRPRVVDLASGSSLALEVVPRDDIGRFLYLYGLWDLAGTRLLQRILRPGMTVLDVGANIGYFTLLAATRVGPSGLVQSFEPHDEIRRRLVRNVERNGLLNVEVRPEAVGRTGGEIAFYRSADASNQGISSTVEGPAPHGEPREARPVLVPCVTLDEVAASLDRPVDLVKIDVEGAELEALAGAELLFAGSQAPLVVFEAYDVGPASELLEGHGYTVWRLDHDPRRGLRFARPTSDVQAEPNYLASKAHHESQLAGLA